MTAPRVAVFDCSLPAVREYLDRKVAEAIREVAGTVQAVRAYCDQLDASSALCPCRPGAECAGFWERQRITADIRALLPKVQS